jgi:hypothetical protein
MYLQESRRLDLQTLKTVRRMSNIKKEFRTAKDFHIYSPKFFVRPSIFTPEPGKYKSVVT